MSTVNWANIWGWGQREEEDQENSRGGGRGRGRDWGEGGRRKRETEEKAPQRNQWEVARRSAYKETTTPTPPTSPHPLPRRQSDFWSHFCLGQCPASPPTPRHQNTLSPARPTRSSSSTGTDSTQAPPPPTHPQEGLCPRPVTSELGEAGLGCVSQWQDAGLPPPHLAATQDLRTEPAGYTEKPVQGHTAGYWILRTQPDPRGGGDLGDGRKGLWAPKLTATPALSELGCSR